MSDELESQNDIISIRANHSYLSTLVNWANGKSALLDQGSSPFWRKIFLCSFVYILSRMISGVYLNVRKRSRMFKRIFWNIPEILEIRDVREWKSHVIFENVLMIVG